MSQTREDKKLRQLFRREMRDKVREMTEEEFGRGDVFKERPKWCPLWLWSKLVAFIIDDSFYFKYEAYQRKQFKKQQDKDKQGADVTPN